MASIVGGSELYVRTGSTISLECVIQGASSIPPRVLFWFHNGKPIALDSPRGGISLTTSRDTGISPGMSSKLLLTRATMADGGNYTCAPPGAQSADIAVHVLNGNPVFLIYLSRHDYLSIAYWSITIYAQYRVIRFSNFILLYEWLTNEFPFTGEHPAAMQRGNRSPSGINGGPSLKHLGAKFLWICQVMSLQYFLYRLAAGNLNNHPVLPDWNRNKYKIWKKEKIKVC